MNAPAGWRTARVIAADARPGDQLNLNNAWWPITTATKRGDLMDFDCCDLPDVVTIGRNTPVVVRWRVGQTTVDLARDVRR